MTKRGHYSAAEIAEMRLPGLPTTKSNVIARAKQEGWKYEEQKGVGGTRRLYEVPEKYLHGTSYGPSKAAAVVLGTVAGGSKNVDTKLLEQVVAAVEQWASARRAVIPPERKAALVALLYDYMAKGAGEDEISQFWRALG